MKFNREAKTRKKRILRLFIPPIFLVVLFMFNPALALSYEGQAASAPSAGTPSQQELDRMTLIAETQHEIVKLLIARGQYGRVVTEVKKILELKLPEQFEEAVAKSASQIAGMLIEKQQFAVAHEVLDEALKRMKLNENKANLFMIQGYTFKSEGKLEKALESLEKAVELRRVRPNRQ
jgi:tetratricopeptide (TPR) repeat protein